MIFPHVHESTIRWLPVLNGAGEEIPAFAAMRVTAVSSEGVYTVAKPNTNDATAGILFNGPVKIATGEYGIGTPSLPATALYDSADGTPAAGENWGVARSDWKLRLARSGFYVLGGANTSATYVQVAEAPSSNHDVLSATHTDSLTDTVVLGDLIHGNATPKWARLAGQITTTLKVLTQTGTGAASAVPEWKSFADVGPVAGGGPVWVKVTKTFADFATAATTNTLTLYNIPIRGILHALVLKASSWNVSTLTNYDVYCSGAGGAQVGPPIDVGDEPNGQAYCFDAAEVGADVTDGGNGAWTTWNTYGAPFVPNHVGVIDFAATKQFYVTAVCAGGNLNVATAGTLDIYLLVSVLP